VGCPKTSVCGRIENNRHWPILINYLAAKMGFLDRRLRGVVVARFLGQRQIYTRQQAQFATTIGSRSVFRLATCGEHDPMGRFEELPIP